MRIALSLLVCSAICGGVRAIPPGLDAATTASSDGRWTQALPLWQSASDRYPNDPDVTAQLGIAEMNSGHVADARRTFSRTLRLAPANVVAQMGLTQIAISDHRYDDAVAIGVKAVRANPESADAYRNLGDAQKAASRRSEAETAYRRAVALAPTDWRNHAALADTMMIRNKAAEAIKEYREALRLHPGDGRLLESLGRADMAGQKYGDAAKAYFDAIDAARKGSSDWWQIDTLTLDAVDALSRAAAALRDGYETREAVYNANTRALEVTDALLEAPEITAADPAANTSMAQRATAYGLLGQAAASDLAALRKTTGTDAADAAVFREQARRAVVAARAAGTTGTTFNETNRRPPSSSRLPDDNDRLVRSVRLLSADGRSADGLHAGAFL